MSSWAERFLAGSVWLLGAAGAAGAPTPDARYPGVGRGATAAEVAAWDTDVRPDFKGLPPGAGSVRQGQQVWEGKCASCHGVLGESTEFFAPLVGGTRAADVAAGRVASLTDPTFPGRTTLMKLASLSTLFDYIQRAMPWTQPKSLTVTEVYAVSAYILNMAGVIDDDFVLSDRNVAQVQQRLPNRNGLQTDHGLWPGLGMGNGGRPDVAAVACMRDCGPAPVVRSSLPDHARNNHGNLALQQRNVGPLRGVDTRDAVARGPAAGDATQRTAAANAVATAAAAPASPARAAPSALLQQHACTACHGIDRRIVGPGFDEIARRYRGRANVEDYLSGKIRHGGAGVWGAVPMPAQSLSEADARAIAGWLAHGAGP